MIASALVCAACARSCSPSVARPASASATSRNALWIERSYWATAMSRLTRGDVEVGAVAAGVEDRLQQLRRAGEGERAALEQARELAARGAEVGGQRDARKERRARRADVGVGGEQLLLGGAHVGPADEQVRRQAGGQVGRDLLPVERQRRRQVGRQRLADEQLQRVLVERALAQRLRQRDARALEQRLGLAEVELRRRAVVEAKLGEPRRLLARRQRLPRDAQQLVVGEQVRGRRWRPTRPG